MQLARRKRCGEAGNGVVQVAAPVHNTNNPNNPTPSRTAPCPPAQKSPNRTAALQQGRSRNNNNLQNNMPGRHTTGSHQYNTNTVVWKWEGVERQAGRTPSWGRTRNASCGSEGMAVPSYKPTNWEQQTAKRQGITTDSGSVQAAKVRNRRTVRTPTTPVERARHAMFRCPRTAHSKKCARR